MLSKAIKGSQVSVFVGVLAAVLATLIGTALGAAAGFFGGKVNDFLEWVYNVFTAVPDILLIFAFAAVLGRGIDTVMLILGLTGWAGVYRQVRAEYMKHVGREYVRAAEAIGASNFSRMFRHILPNASHVILVRMSLLVVGFIKAEVILSYLGLGVPVDEVSWGTMLAEAQSELILGHWWQLVAATAFMCVFVTAFSLMADACARRTRSQVEGPGMSPPLLSIRDLHVSFRLGRDERGQQQVAQAVKGVSFDIPANSTVALVGESGSGKSVTAMSILNLLPDNAERRGSILWHDKLGQQQDLLKASSGALQAMRGKEIACVFQDPMSSLNPVFTVGAQVVEPLMRHMGMNRRAALERAEQLFVEVGMPDPKRRLDFYPHEMSGGQQQRVMIAMALACEPKLLIADEPTTALDVTIQRQILELLDKVQKSHAMSVLFISHDLGVVGEIADHVVVMRQGTVREQGPVARIFTAPEDAYTRALLACRPSCRSPRGQAAGDRRSHQRPPGRRGRQAEGCRRPGGAGSPGAGKELLPARRSFRQEGVQGRPGRELQAAQGAYAGRGR